MKKYLIALAALCGFTMQAKADTDLSTLTNVVYVENATLTQGLTQNLSINLKNADVIKSFQCEITLPEGITYISTTAAGARVANTDYSAASNLVEGVVRVVMASTGGSEIAPGDGQTIAMSVAVSPTMALNSYPVKVNAKVGGVWVEAETTITITDRITLDENATEAPADAEGAKVKVLRTIKANEWSTICLPFAMTANQVADAFGEGVQLADFKGYEATEENDEIVSILIDFETVSAIEANHPYIIKVGKDIAEFNADNVNIAAGDAIVKADGDKNTKRKRFVGNYVAGFDLSDGDFKHLTLFLNGGKFFYAVNGTKMKAFRGYFEFCDMLTNVEDEYGVKAFINIDGMASGVVELKDNVKANGAIFNLAGQRVSKAQKGIFIQNGKKTVIK